MDYLLKRSDNKITIASRKLENSVVLAKGRSQCVPIALDVNDQGALEAAIAQHDLVISLIPYTFHAQVIAAAIKSKKHVVTTSYVSPAMQQYDQA